MIPLNIPPEILIGAPLVTLALLFYQSVYRLMRKEISRLETKVSNVEGRIKRTEDEADQYRKQMIELKATIDRQIVVIATLMEELKKKGLTIEALQSEGNHG